MKKSAIILLSGLLCQFLLVNVASQDCPDGSSQVNCLTDPCIGTTCPGVEGASCMPDYCGGCNYKYVKDDRDVTIECLSICPDDAPLVRCFADPCLLKNCSKYPNATCIPNYCGGCNAHFFLNGRNVTNMCENVFETCADGSAPITCLPSPCMGTSCSAVLGSRCIPDYCGGCNFKYIDGNGVDVTIQCSKTICPDDVPPVLCYADPCLLKNCSKYPNATCTPNYCDGCNAHFFLSGRNVTNMCENVMETCADGSSPVTCLSNPCIDTSCSAVLGSRCIPDYCGGCNFKYIDGNGVDVTNQCSQRFPMSIKQAVCPNINASLPSFCTTNCMPRQKCANGQLCCTKSCGNVCSTPEFVPYYPVAPVCPSPTFSLRPDICPLSDVQCMNNSGCRGDHLCCRSRCGRICQKGVLSSIPCFMVTESIGAYQSLQPPGYYTPSCQTDGTFMPIQCNPSTNLCWCVDIKTGKPVSSYYRRGVTPTCSGAGPNPGCNYNNRAYAVGESFLSTDGCNKCSCLENGRVLCTLRACGPEVCSLRPDMGPCKALIPAYYFNRKSSKCEKFTYGGCQGNGNKYATIGDCLQRCNPTSLCLENKEPGLCEAYMPSYYFNSSSSRCERFVYGGCGGNRNRFETLLACSEACTAKSESFECPSTSACTSKKCVHAHELIRNDRYCCPYCRPMGPRCKRKDYKCSNGKCIGHNLVCDGLRDCRDGGDERDCSHECEFRCYDGTCIPRSEVCDTILDCRDGRDVRNCTTTFSNVNYLTYEDLPLTCPDLRDTVGVCISNCRSDSECNGGKKCCSNSCGTQTCMAGIPPTYLCQIIRRQSEASGLLGRFSPHCQPDGSFKEMQCHERYCWCVDVISGQPVSEGMIGKRHCSDSKCVGTGGLMLSSGESQRSADGCNTCTCIAGGRFACTRKACPTAPCRFGRITVSSNTTYEDDCNTCLCLGGSLRCTKKACTTSTVTLQTLRRRYQASIPFSGDYNVIIRDKERFERHIMKAFLGMYGISLGLIQEQIVDVQVEPGSIIVVLTLVDSNTNTEGANITILVGQITQDFENKLLIIRYDGYVLEPTGAIETIDLDDNRLIKGMRPSRITIIVVIVIFAVLLAVVAITFIAIAINKKHLSAVSAGDTPTINEDKPHLALKNIYNPKN